ncbi:asparagine synthase (glutamine-hydrolyzing) [Paenibacillus endoradicis]|uniref:asparagine synthase (glutamine-hydrolyzing) n=1 Tax=Paenibacillus endoradicis TaxID=2972487 RepID=UPI002158EDA3|nr:asparagine synthase (glutamine-hydrolyzing) [Paenibacillus endoradicis]MCR8660111.1 asparagine synthase (glutamine-hydrolyzing) [Paenibacillus endoradicis]
MCGFVSIFNKNNIPVDPHMLAQMTDIITHRGPDDEGMHIDDHIGLGFRRLSMLDIENGAQPLRNQHDDIWLVFNGEIYNYLELKTWLIERGHLFHTRSDTEVLLRLYEEVGTECPKYLRGMFAFTIWDKRHQMMFSACDHFGIKPLYYTDTPTGYMIGSEIKSLLASGKLVREVDEHAFYHYLTFQYVPEPATMFKSIYKLKAGHSMIMTIDSITIEPFFEVQFNPDTKRSFPDLVEEARSVITESVRLHRNSDTQRGAFLSGGIDSSGLAALLQRLEPTKTFSVGFDIPGYSELDMARTTAKYLGTEHHEISVNAKDYMDILPSLIWHMDEPVADPSLVGLYFVSKLASQHVKMVFSGEGADEFFGGYNIYHEPHSLRHFNYMPSYMKRMVGQLAELMPAGMKGKSFLERGIQPLEKRYFGNAKIFGDSEKAKLLSQWWMEAGLYSPTSSITSPLYDKAIQYDPVTQMQYIDIHTWLRGNILMKADKMSMANSLELRVPYIDIEVFKFAAKLPTDYKVTPNDTKILFREAMKGIVPSIVQTRKKLGFPVPIRVWLKNEWYDWAKQLIHSANVEQWLNKTYVLQLLEVHKAGKMDNSRKLWTILMFMLWHQIYIEQPIAVSKSSIKT